MEPGHGEVPSSNPLVASFAIYFSCTVGGGTHLLGRAGGTHLSGGIGVG
jgi:hypothetical protein